MSVRSPPLSTKMQRPPVHAGLISRERLLRLMSAGQKRTLTVIKAAAGFGKTSLALAWADRLVRAGRKVAWISLDEEDDEPGQFLLYVAHALRTASPEIGSQALDLIAEIALVRPIEVVKLLLNAISELEEEIYLFLDDYHALGHPDIAVSFAYLLRHAPPQLRVILTTRIEPKLPLVKLRAGDRLFEIDAEALRFDLDETRRFLETEFDTSVGTKEVATLHEKTEGWPVMMRIVATTTQQTGQDVADYIAGLSIHSRPIRSHIIEMLDGLPEYLRAFLTRVSILESLTIPLCAALTQLPDSEPIVEQLATLRLLLTPVDGDRTWFRCHPLLRSYLRQRLETQFPDEVGELHRRAYTWYSVEARWTEAIRHAIAAGDPAAAAQWIDRCAMALLKRGELLTLLAWEKLIPADLMRRQVKTRLAIAWSMALAMRCEESLALASTIEREIATSDAYPELSITCECLTIRANALALADDIDAALPLALESLARNESGRWTSNVASNIALIGSWRLGRVEECYAIPWIAIPMDTGARNVVATVYRHCLMGIIEYEQLNQSTAVRHFEDALRIATDVAGANSATATQPLCLLAMSRYEQGALEEAEELIANRLTVINAICMLDCVLRAYTVLIRTAARAGRIARALSLIEQAECVGASRHWPRLEAAARYERIRLVVAEGRLIEAEVEVARVRHLAEAAAAMPTVSGEILDLADLAQSWVASGREDYATAVTMTRAVRQRALVRHNARLALEAEARLAILLFQSGNPREAVAIGHPALERAGDVGRSQVFVDAEDRRHPTLTGLLRLIDLTAASAELRAFRNRIADAAKPPAAYCPNQSAAGRVARVSLSAQENRVLSLLAEGETNKEIARTLNIAPETVKTHVRNIFAKLEISSRSQAVSRAVTLGLGRASSGT